MKERIYKPQHLRVLIITPSLAPGGAEQQIRTLINHADRVTYTGIMVSPTQGQRIWYPVNYSIPVIESEWESGDTVESAMVRSVTENWGKVHADVIMYWGFGPLDLRHLGVPVIHVMHGSVRDHATPAQLEWIKERSDSYANYLVGVSHSAADAFSERAKAKNETSTVIHNGVDLERVSVQRGGQAQREIWGIPEEMNIMLYVGRLFLGKGPEKVVGALKHLPEDYGAVAYGWGDMLPELREMAEDYPGRVWFPQPKLDKLGDVYAAADVVVIPSSSEAFPLVMVEAWHAGCRLVCSEFSTLLVLEETYRQQLAYHIPCPPSAVDVASEVKKAVGNEIGNIEMNAMSIARQHYTAGAMVFRWEEFFYQCANEWRRWGQIGGVERS